MSRLRVHGFAISLDGYGAGPNQSLENPLGEGGTALHGWTFATRQFRQHLGLPDADAGGTGIDNGYLERAVDNLGAWVLGRNMFGPVRGPWPDESWRGWWGDRPPYGVPVFVLTHHARPALAMDGGTVFHFVTGGLDEALARAHAAAQGRDVRLGGGVATLRAALAARKVDAMHLAVSPVLLGRGEALFAGLDLPALGYALARHEQGEGALHLTFERRDGM